MHHARLAVVAPIALLGSIVAMVLVSPSFGHVDDPKERDRMPAYIGPAYRAGEGGLARSGFNAGGGSGGVAGDLGFESEGMVLLSWLPLNELDGAASGNDCWGYVSTSGREYALMGTSLSTVIVEVTNASNAQVVATIPGPQSTWRDIKVYQHYAYAVSEGGQGIQVIDLGQIDNGVATLVGTVTTGGTMSTHNVAINETSGYLYRCGGGSNGLRIYSLANPAAPVHVATWSDKYVHDCQVVTYEDGPYKGREIAFCCAGFNGGWVDTGLTILDVTDKKNIFVVGTVEYPNGAYSHQGWLSADRLLFYLNDEVDESTYDVSTTTHVIDVSVLEKPVQVSTFTSGSTSVDHNLYVRDNLVFEANYRSGLRVFDASDPLAPVQIAYFDTFPGSDSPNYNGMWSTYPFLPSGAILCSDIERGLFVLYLGEPPLTFSYPGSLPALVAPSGHVVHVSISAAEGLSVAEGSAKMIVNIGEGQETVELVEIEPGLYEGVFPDLSCGEPLSYSFTATASNGISLSDPPVAVEATVAVAYEVKMVDPIEEIGGWIAGLPGDTATSGQWVHVDPVGTTAQPEDDHTPAPGVRCWVTGQGLPGGGAGDADIDSGVTTLTSPLLDATGPGEAHIEYYRWYSNNLGSNPGSDSMSVLISPDDGQSWVLLEEVNDNTGTWTKRSFRIADFVAPTSQMRLRFIARDIGLPSLVEAGVDDVSIVLYSCESTSILGDLNGDGIVDGADLGELLAQWGGPGSADLNGDGTVDGADLGMLLAAWGR